MEITVQYTGQLAAIAGVSEETITVDDALTLRKIVDDLAGKYPDGFLDMLQTEAGNFRPSLLVILDGEQAEGDLEVLSVKHGQTLMLMTPIAGG